MPEGKPTALGALTDEEFNSIIEQGLADYADGKIYSAEQVRTKMRKELGV